MTTGIHELDRFEVLAAMMQKLIDERGNLAPHRDNRVLHAPGECWACDGFPDWQEAREAQCINFTGRYDEDKCLCPAEGIHGNPLEDLHANEGNQPIPRKQAGPNVEIRWFGLD